MSEKKIVLEDAFEQLEDMIAKLESSDVSLEDSFAYYKAGMELVKQCNEEIDRIEKQVKILTDEEQ